MHHGQNRVKLKKTKLGKKVHPLANIVEKSIGSSSIAFASLLLPHIGSIAPPSWGCIEHVGHCFHLHQITHTAMA